MRRAAALLLLLALASAPVPRAAEDNAPTEDGATKPAHKPATAAERRAAIAKLIEGLQSEQWDVRTRAARDLEAYGAEALPQLTALKTDEDPELARSIATLTHKARMAAVGTLGGEVGESLERFAELQPTERVTAVHRLAQKARAEAVPLLIGLLDGEQNEQVQQAILRNLKWLNIGSDGVAALQKFHKRCPENLKGDVLYILAKFPTPESRALVREALKSETPALCIQAMAAIRRMGDRESLPEIRRLARGGEAVDANLQAEALDTLTGLADDQAGPIFREVIEKGGPEGIQLDALRGLAGLRDPQDAALLRKIYKDESRKELHAMAIWAMGALRDPSFVPELKAVVADPKNEVRDTALAALRPMLKPEDGALAAGLLDDEDVGLVRTAIEIVGDLRYKDAATKLKSMLGTRERDIQLLAAEALAALDDPDGEAGIIRLADDAGDYVADTAMARIGEWHIRKGLPRLREAAKKGRADALMALLAYNNDAGAFRELAATQMREYLRNPNSAYAAAALARVYKERGLVQRAITPLESILRRDPLSRSILSRLSSYYHELGAYNKSEAAFDRWAALTGGDGDQATILNNRAWLYCTAFRKDYLRPKVALDMVERALAINPTSEHFIDTLGWSHFVCGEHEKAIAELRRALALHNPANTHMVAWQRTRLARPLWASGKKDEALAEVRQALDSADEDDEVWFEAAGFYGYAGLRDECMHALHMAIELGWVQVEPIEMNPEFDSLLNDPGFRYAIQRATEKRAALERELDTIEQALRKALPASPEAPPDEADGEIFLED